MDTNEASPQPFDHLPPDVRPTPGLMWTFVGVDLAPNDSLETGVVTLNRERRIMRMDKLGSDEQILGFIQNLGPAANIVVALDVPKSLSLPNRWRQEAVKMFPLRMQNDGSRETTDRCADRAWQLYDQLRAMGVTVFLYFNHMAKVRYQVTIPFRSRTPRGCRALQLVIHERLKLDDMPKNLSPTSVLDAMIGAYAAWSLYRGTPDEDYDLFLTLENRLMLDPVQTVPERSTVSAREVQRSARGQYHQRGREEREAREARRERGRSRGRDRGGEDRQERQDRKGRSERTERQDRKDRKGSRRPVARAAQRPDRNAPPPSA